MCAIARFASCIPPPVRRYIKKDLCRSQLLHRQRQWSSQRRKIWVDVFQILFSPFCLFRAWSMCVSFAFLLFAAGGRHSYYLAPLAAYILFIFTYKNVHFYEQNIITWLHPFTYSVVNLPLLELHFTETNILLIV
ncbi:unnamed protein product [Laminaria digitata]